MTTSQYIKIQTLLIIIIGDLSREQLSDFEAMASELGRQRAVFITDHDKVEVPIPDPQYMASLAGAAIRFLQHTEQRGKDMGVALSAQKSAWKKKTA